MKRRWTWARRATALSFLVLLVLGARPWFPYFKGSTTATTLLEVIPICDPLAALEVWLASKSMEATLLGGALILAFVGILLGPVFCGWACPLGLLLDVNEEIRRRLKRLPAFQSPREIRYAALGLALGFSITAGLPAFQTLSPINFISWVLVFHPGTAHKACILMLLVLALILFLDYFAPRFFCRGLCPLGALYSLLGRFAILKVRPDEKAACPPSCRLCTFHCPMGIEVRRDCIEAGEASIVHPECTRCGACVDQCPNRKLRMGFKR